MINVKATLQYRFNGWDLEIDDNIVEFESMEPTTPETSLLNDLVEYSFGFADDDGEVNHVEMDWEYVAALIIGQLGPDVSIEFDIGSDS